MTNLPTDTYYRGYRISQFEFGDTHIYYGSDRVESVSDPMTAREIIDGWLDAR